MIEIPTTLILGAGASKPYGYPLGSELKSNIISSIKEMENNNSGWASEIKFFDDDKLVTDFLGKFATTPRSSIDNFLAYQKWEFAAIGKVAITYEMIKAENKGNLEPENQHLYQYLTRKLFECPFEELGKNISIISYNYDRSLETYLYYALVSSFSECNDDPAECMKLINNLPIIHMYGRLDELPWEQKNARKYGDECSTHRLLQISKNIKLVHESEELGTVDQANKILEETSRIYFLGLDLYNNISNIELLDTSLFEKKNILATVLGLLQGEITEVKEYFRSKKGSNTGIWIMDNDSLRAIRTRMPLK